LKTVGGDDIGDKKSQGRDQEFDKEDEVDDNHRIHATYNHSDTFKVDKVLTVKAILGP
jgi:hypothetical protein